MTADLFAPEPTPPLAEALRPHTVADVIGQSHLLGEGQAGLEATGRFRIDVIPGTSHFLPMERPELVREALLEVVGS